MKSLLAVAVVFVAAMLALSASGKPQQVEHAPTVAQCRADARLWIGTSQTVSAGVLAYEGVEITTCRETIDPSNDAGYSVLLERIAVENSVRFLDFIRRHNLYSQFFAEDAAGKR